MCIRDRFYNQFFILFYVFIFCAMFYSLPKPSPYSLQGEFYQFWKFLCRVLIRFTTFIQSDYYFIQWIIYFILSCFLYNIRLQFVLLLYSVSIFSIFLLSVFIFFYYHQFAHVLCVDTCLLYTSPSPRDQA
eukprot:TRINITY_DN27088_c0_g1_i1.p1 TRINITY_DN27088_c0_g1~~TRINITY_DN27088_c0_g1_i1.p1  ORF type:complete len:131 (-),score=2.32 TRINITY_DN27088_c0_g1_i1:108-500(-)